MRIPLHKIYRAFPELDRFDDDLCKRFMKRACSNRLEQVLAAVMIVLVMVTVWAIVERLGEVGYSIWPWFAKVLDARWGVAPIAVLVSLQFLAAALAGMLVRDLMVQWMVRRLIRKRGTCRACGYSLLGMVVPADLKIICPECGKVTVSSPVLHELVTDAQGRNVVRSEVA